MSDFFANGQESSQLTYKPSSHLFTDPIRYFKANDPYYWEVDNIPLKQVQQNILWLKDQVGTTIEGVEDAVTRDNFIELRPRAAGDSNVVTVDPGRFMGRVNDAYGTGISNLVVNAYSDYAASKYNTDITVDLEDSVLRELIGETINGMLGNNGLYDLLQHHVTNSPIGDKSEWGSTIGTFEQNNEGLTNVINLPKIKLALWKQDNTADNYSQDVNKKVDLQQMSVDFTRAWGAPFRTALVNVENQLSIEVPSFDENDYMDNNETYVPSTRIDLLFVYTKPIDASSTRIAYPNGNDPMEITTPQLGIVKGAGVIALNGAGDWEGDTVNTDFLNDGKFTDNREDPNYYFKASGGLDSEGNNQISSPLGDQNQTLMGTSGVYGNFPSPDDLMNLSPYIVNGLVGTKNLALVGQSILPIAYIFVSRGQISITNSHILDIRPFFRTTELTYNERAGIAASNPPASLANPFITNSDLVHRLEVFNKNIPAPPELPPIPPMGRVLIAQGAFRVYDNDKVWRDKYWNGDILNCKVTRLTNNTTQVDFEEIQIDTSAQLDATGGIIGTAPGYIVKTTCSPGQTHRHYDSDSRYTYAYVAKVPGRTSTGFTLQHAKPATKDNYSYAHDMHISFEVFDYPAPPADFGQTFIGRGDNDK